MPSRYALYVCYCMYFVFLVRYSCAVFQYLLLLLVIACCTSLHCQLTGQLSQPKRLGALNKFKAGARNVLVATDVASRGLDIPNVDLVINYDIPANGKDYIHR